MVGLYEQARLKGLFASLAMLGAVIGGLVAYRFGTEETEDFTVQKKNGSKIEILSSEGIEKTFHNSSATFFKRPEEVFFIDRRLEEGKTYKGTHYGFWDNLVEVEQATPDTGSVSPQ